MRAPAWTVAVRSACSCATRALRRFVLSRMSTDEGVRPQPIFVPPPRITTDARCFDADASAAARSSADAGSIDLSRRHAIDRLGHDHCWRRRSNDAADAPLSRPQDRLRAGRRSHSFICMRTPRNVRLTLPSRLDARDTVRELRRRAAASERPCPDCTVPSDRTRGARSA